jgi:hypothetical protein
MILKKLAVLCRKDPVCTSRKSPLVLFTSHKVLQLATGTAMVTTDETH